MTALNWRGTWPPSDTVELGDVGILRDGLFELQTTLADLGVRFARKAARSRASFDYQSSSGVSVKTKMAGETSKYFTSVGDGRAGVAFRFSRRGAVVFSAPSCQIIRIAAPASLQPELRWLWDNGYWEPDWMFVSAIVKARSATVLVARSRRAGVELRAAASVTAVDLARIGVGLKLAGHNNMEVRMVAKGNLVPLYQMQELTL